MSINKIMISNIYSWKNKGDAAIVLTMIDDVKKQFPEAEIVLSSLDPNDDEKYGDYQVQKNIAYFVYDGVQRYRYKIILMLFFLMRFYVFYGVDKIIRIKPYFIFGKSLRSKLKSYKDVDLIIACGGGYMLTETKSSIFGKYMFWHDFFTGYKLFDKPFILYNQSVGPFYNKFHQKLASRMLSCAKQIICREELTYNRMNELGMANITLRSDIAFNLKMIADDSLLTKNRFSSDHTNIGLTVRKWMSADKQVVYETAIADFISKVCSEDSSAKFYFMPQVIFGDNNDNDLFVSKNIYNLIDEKYKQHVVVIEEDMHPSVLKYIISKMDYFVGTRMHSNIFALSSLIKTIAIAYEPKTLGIMKMLHLSDYAFEMEKVSGIKLYDKFMNLKSDEEYVINLQNKMKEIDGFTVSDLNELAH